MFQPLQCNEFRWPLTTTQVLYRRSSSKLSSKASAVFNSHFEVWASKARHSVQVTVSSNIKLHLSPLCPSHSCNPKRFSHHTILTVAIRQLENPILRKMAGSGVSAVLQLLQHQVMGNMYHTGHDSRARLQL